MQKATIWFTTLAGGQIGVHYDNLIMEEAEFREGELWIEIQSTGEVMTLRCEDNKEGMEHYYSLVGV